MGINCLRGFLKGSRRRVKIMKADGTVMKLWSPVHAKELLGCYPDHEIFEADVTGRPVSQSAELRPGRLYFLIPLRTQPEICSKAFSDTDLRTEEADDNKWKSNRSGVVKIISSTDKCSTVRIRIRVSKEEFSSLLSVNRNTLMEDIVAPLIKQAISNHQLKSSDSFSRQWKPSLETISE